MKHCLKRLAALSVSCSLTLLAGCVIEAPPAVGVAIENIASPQPAGYRPAAIDIFSSTAFKDIQTWDARDKKPGAATSWSIRLSSCVDIDGKEDAGKVGAVLTANGKSEHSFVSTALECPSKAHPENAIAGRARVSEYATVEDFAIQGRILSALQTTGVSGIPMPEPTDYPRYTALFPRPGEYFLVLTAHDAGATSNNSDRIYAMLVYATAKVKWDVRAGSMLSGHRDLFSATQEAAAVEKF